MMESSFVYVSIGQAELDLHRMCRERHIPFQVPMNIEVLAQRNGSTIVPVPNLRRKFGIVGGVGKNPYRKIEADFAIYIDKSVADGEIGFYNETLAEELAHIIYDRCEVAAMRTMSNILELHQRTEWVERESNRELIGRVFCMPSLLLERALPRVYETVVERDGWGANAFDDTVLEMAREFKVTLEGMKARLTECTDLITRLHKSIGMQSQTLLKVFSNTKTNVRRTIRKPKAPEYHPLFEGVEDYT